MSNILLNYFGVSLSYSRMKEEREREREREGEKATKNSEVDTVKYQKIIPNMINNFSLYTECAWA